jgi:hypothetical protein
MKELKDNGLRYYQFELFEGSPELAHGVFTRDGGVSLEPQSGLNLAFMPDDTEDRVRTNQDLAAGALGLSRLTFAGQVHGEAALVVRLEDEYFPRRPKEMKKGYDALITPDAGVGLLVKLADCQGAILYDPRTKVLALVHSGWRGSVSNILGKTVARLEAEFGVNPADLLCGISPSLGPCCAEFVNYREELPEEFTWYRDGCHFDFWAISRAQLTAAGLKDRHVEIAGLCTKCGGHGFYSYRRDRITGRFGLMAGRREES